MVRVVGNLPLVALVLSVWTQCDSFVIPVGRATTARLAINPRARALADTSKVQVRPQRMYEVWRRRTTLSVSRNRRPAVPDSEGQTGVEIEEQDPTASMSRFSRISQRLRKMVRKAIMGYLPEEEAAADAAAEATAAAQRLASTQVRDHRLQEDAAKARAAAVRVVAKHDNDDHSPNKDIVQLDIGDQSPMEAEDMIASLRKRIEHGMQPDPEAAAAERRRQIAMQQRKERMGREASFQGDTAVAERPRSDKQTASGRQPPQASPVKRETPKLASSEDIERLERMFGSMGGEMLP